MKTHLYITIISLLLVACDDNLFLDPHAQESFITYYDNEANLEEAIVGVYSPMVMNGDEGPYSRYYMIFDALSGDSEVCGEDELDQIGMQNISLYRKNTSSETPSLVFWQNFYIGISRANTVIEEVSKRTYKNESFQKQIIAEAKFLRAHYYFELTKFFGPVVLIKETPDPTKLPSFGNRSGGSAGSQVAEQYAFIKENLLEAIPHLKTKVETGNDGRANKEAACALLAKAYMYEYGYANVFGYSSSEENWTEAEKYIDQALNNIDLGAWKKYPYHKVFKQENENDLFSLFAVQFSPSADYARLGSIRTIDQNPRAFLDASGNLQDGTQYGYGLNCPTAQYVSLFDEGDPRLDLVGKEGDSAYTVALSPAGYYKIAFKGTCHYTGYVNRKNEVPANHPLNSTEKQAQGLNIELIRVADVLLMKAEISAHLNKLGEALDYVNMVRERARNSKKVRIDGKLQYTSGDIPADYNGFGSQAEALEKIYKERRLELGLESHTFFDIVRTGRAGEVFSNRGDDVFGRSFEWTDGVNEVLPIPFTEISLHDGSLKQNEGY